MTGSFLSQMQTLAFGLGIYPPSPKAFMALPSFLREYRAFKHLLRNSGKDWPLSRSPILPDRFGGSGSLPRHYFLQDILVANRIHAKAPKRHVDVGSRLDGFIGHVASFREIEVLDIRPQGRSVKNVVFKQADIMTLDDSGAGYCDSLSCLHTLEHLGLGRYGDRIDPLGHAKGLAGLARLLAKGGTLYLSVPMGRQRIEFNNQRVFSLPTILGLVEAGFEISSFSYIDDADVLHEDVPLPTESVERSFGCEYGLAILELTKR